MRKEPVEVSGTSQPPNKFLLLVCFFKIGKNTMIAYELCENSVNAVKPETSTMFILSRIHVAL